MQEPFIRSEHNKRNRAVTGDREFVVQPAGLYGRHTVFHEENPTRCNIISKFLLLHIYMKLNMFRATHSPLSVA
jgi:hypothetical protein